MSTLRTLIKKITHPFLKLGLAYFYRKPRKYSYQNIEVLVHPEVFPPHLTLSTKILLDFISEKDLKGKFFLELGCGSGIISLLASKKGAKVTASDINKTALDYLNKASEKNDLPVTTVYSNLFEKIQDKSFDYIIINPPYYPKQPKSIKDQAWYCGDNFDYFRNLFNQLPPYLSKKNKTYMILSEDCEVKKIKKISSIYGINFQLSLTKKSPLEKNYIYRLTKAKK